MHQKIPREAEVKQVHSNGATEVLAKNQVHVCLIGRYGFLKYQLKKKQYQL